MGPGFSKLPGEALNGNHGHGKAVLPLARPVTKFVAEIEQICAEYNIIAPPEVATLMEDAIARNLAARRPAIVEASLVRRLRAPVVDMEPGIKELKMYIEDFEENMKREETQNTLKHAFYVWLGRKPPPSKSFASMEIDLEMLKFQLDFMETSAVANRKSAAIGHKFADMRLPNGNDMAAQLAPVAGPAGIAEQPAEDEADNDRMVHKLGRIMGNLCAAGNDLTVLVDHAKTEAAERKM